MNDKEIKLVVKCHKNFWVFCLYMYPEIYEKRRDQLFAMCNLFQYGFENGGTYSIQTPPRTAKSLTSNLFCAWIILINREKSIIRASYSQTLSEKLHRSVRQIIESEKYQFLNNVNKKEMKKLKDTASELHFKNSDNANLFSTSVGGSVTGSGANVLILDDPYKDHNEALSDTINDRTINWYDSAFKSRLEIGNGVIFIVGTRWTNKEITAKLEKSNSFDKILKIKALTKDNVSFNEDIITTPMLLENKKLMHPSIFNSMYQQEPFDSLEPLFLREELNFVNFKNEDTTFRLIVMDPANEGADRTALVCLDICDGTVYATDLMSDVRELKKLEKNIEDFVTTYSPNLFLIEKNFNDIYINSMAAKFKKMGIDTKTFRTTTNKQTKILRSSGYIKSIKFFNTTDYGYNDFINKILEYDVSRRNQHDDEIDTMAMAVEWILKIRNKYNLKIWGNNG